jgi:hypothetical protein
MGRRINLGRHVIQSRKRLTYRKVASIGRMRTSPAFGVGQARE